MSQRSFVHVETATRHRAGTAQFLTAMFGWDDVQHFSDPAPYAAFHSNRAVRTNDSVLLYVGSDDIEADLQKARSLGARVVAPMTEVTGSGWFAIIEDPHGSRIALWS